MADMTLTMTFKAVDEATATMRQIMEAEREVQASVRAGAEATATAATQEIAAGQQRVETMAGVAEAARTTAAAIANEAAAWPAQPRGDRTFGPVEWSDDTPDQIAGRAAIQNLRDLADQQRMFRDAEAFERELQAGLGGAVADAVAEAISPSAPPPPAWSDRKFGPIEWADDTAEQAAGREEVRMMRAFAAEAQAAAELDRQLSPLRDTAQGIADAMDGISGSGAADALGAAGRAAGEAAPMFGELVSEALRVQGLGQEFGRAFGRVVGSLGSAFLLTGVEYAASQLVAFAHEALTKEQMIQSALKGHAELVRDVDAAYRSAADGIDAYEASSASVLAWRAQRNVVELEAAFEAIQGNVRSSGVFNPLYERTGANAWDIGGFFGRDLGPLRETVELLRSGDITAEEGQRRFGDIGQQLPQDSRHHAQIKEALDRLDAEIDAQRKLEEARAQVERTQALLQDRVVVSTNEAVPDAAPIEEVASAFEALPPAVADASSAIDDSAAGYEALDPAAAAAAASVGQSADEIARAGQNAAAAAEQVGRLQAMFQALGSAFTAMPFRAAGQAAAANTNAPPAANINEAGFEDGGYTGDMARDAIAGFVHGREYVFDADATAAIGVANLDAFRAAARSGQPMLPAIASAGQARGEVAALQASAMDGGTAISVQLSAPVTITGNAPRPDIEREVLAVMETSGRKLAEIIDEQLRLRSRRRH